MVSLTKKYKHPVNRKICSEKTQNPSRHLKTFHDT